LHHRRGKEQQSESKANFSGQKPGRVEGCCLTAHRVSTAWASRCDTKRWERKFAVPPPRTTPSDRFRITVCCFKCISNSGDFSINRSNLQQAKSPALLDLDTIIGKLNCLPESGRIRPVGKPFVTNLRTGAL